eukprot:CAMPEP_0183737088 /NCGR_PEP_ID=MMETSP0737-20130205/51033_1 /TAXON_ID=385413 /ORGANISM="Thalassiosira miniscula, Strain CCMP1093" /LENGTH=85 /DNA_ID=CAMNT_0025971283 /DNA_START=117 /DNA_END=371 /DNA_ORIENTATION=+
MTISITFAIGAMNINPQVNPTIPPHVAYRHRIIGRNVNDKLLRRERRCTSTSLIGKNPKETKELLKGGVEGKSRIVVKLQIMGYN